MLLRIFYLYLHWFQYATCFRIDYAICDKGFLTEVLEADIVKMQKQWSDHAAVVVVLKEQPSLPPHPAPALSSRNMKRFNEDPRQKKLTALFNKGSKRPPFAVEPRKTLEGLPSWLFFDFIIWNFLSPDSVIDPMEEIPTPWVT